MTIDELYEQIGGNYDDALARLRSEALVTRVLEKFLNDTTCPALIEAWGRGDETAAFEAAHAAKGVCLNLAFTRLGVLASDITEALRPGNEGLRESVDVDVLVEQLAAEYEHVLAGVRSYLESR